MIFNIALDEDTNKRIISFCDQHGCTVSALTEACFRRLLAFDEDGKDEVYEETVQLARQIAASRRRRRPDD